MKNTPFKITELSASLQRRIKEELALPTKEALSKLKLGKSDDASGTSLQGTIEVDFDTLVKLYGQPTRHEDSKVQAEWVLRAPDATVVTIYDYKEKVPAEEVTDWHIGGRSQKVLDLVSKDVGKPAKKLYSELKNNKESASPYSNTKVVKDWKLNVQLINDQIKEGHLGNLYGSLENLEILIDKWKDLIVKEQKTR
jgi:hypothetical protein